MGAQISIIALILSASLILANSNLVDLTFAEISKQKDNGSDTFKKSTKGTAKITSKAKTGTDKYVFKISVCAGKESVQKPIILLKSDREQFIGVAKLSVQPQKCRDFASQIISNDSTTIKSMLLEGKEIPKGLKVKQIK